MNIISMRDSVTVDCTECGNTIERHCEKCDRRHSYMCNRCHHIKNDL